MANRHWVGNAAFLGLSNNWNYNTGGITNWGSASGVIDNVAPPTVADTVTFDGAGLYGNQNSTISATISCLSLTITAYTGTMTHNAVLTVAGNLTLSTSYTIAGTSSMTISATSTITSNGKTWPNAMTWSGSNTKAIIGDFTVSGILTVSGITTINKTTIEKLNVGGLSLSQALSGTSDIYLTGGSWTVTGGINRFISNNVFIQGDVTISGPNVGFRSGTLKYNSGTIVTTGSTLNLEQGCTLDTNGITWENVTMTTSTQTFTLNSLFNISGTFNILSSTISGTSGFTCATLLCSTTGVTTISLKEAVTYTVTSALTCYLSRVGAVVLFTSAHATTKAILTLQNNAGTICNVLADFTRIDASGGRTINTFASTITDCLNVRQYFDSQNVAL